MIRNRMIGIALAVCAFLALTLASCHTAGLPGDSSADESGQTEYEDTNQRILDSFYCDSFYTSTIPYKINLVSGDIVVPCPDPLCDHGNDSVNCPLRHKACFYQVDGGRYFFYVAGLAQQFSLYCFDSVTNRTESVFEFSNIDNLDPVFGDGKLFFRNPILEKIDGQWVEKPFREVLYYDTEDGKIHSFGQCSAEDRLYWYRDGELGFKNKEGLFAVAKDSFSDSRLLKAPEIYRSRFGTDSFDDANGRLLLKYSSPPAVFIRDQNRFAILPKRDGQETFVFCFLTGSNLYLQASDGGFFGRGEYYRTGGDPRGFYQTKVFVVDKEGHGKRYDIISDYCFFVLKGYQNWIFAEIWSQYVNGEEVEENGLDATHIRINLDTGEADLYNLGKGDIKEVPCGKTSVSVSASNAVMEESGQVYAPSEDDASGAASDESETSSESSYPDVSGTETPDTFEDVLPLDQPLEDEAARSGYYCPPVMSASSVPCRLDIRNGTVLYACPVDGCSHITDDCFYSGRQILGTYDTGLYLLILTRDTGFSKVQLRAFRYSDGRMFIVPLERILGRIEGCEGSRLYFSDSSYDKTYIYVWDLSSKTSKTYSLDSCQIYYEKDGFLYAQDEKGAFKFSSDGIRTDLTLPESVQDRAAFKFRKDGFAYKTDAPAAIYDQNTDSLISLPVKQSVTSPVKDGETYYFQTRRKLASAKDANGNRSEYIPYDKTIYGCGTDGTMTKTKVHTDYGFIIYAVSGDYAVGRLMYLLDGDVYVPYEKLEYDHIRIHLKDGSYELLNLRG